MHFDQIFFIVNNKMHTVLLSLPALISTRCRLLTVDGRDLMPETHSALTLDLTKVDQHRECATQGLNSLAYHLIEQGPIQSSETTWKNLNFEDFGPQPICVLTDKLKNWKCLLSRCCQAWLEHMNL